MTNHKIQKSIKEHYRSVMTSKEVKDLINQIEYMPPKSRKIVKSAVAKISEAFRKQCEFSVLTNALKASELEADKNRNDKKKKEIADLFVYFNDVANKYVKQLDIDEATLVKMRKIEKQLQDRLKN